MNVLFVAPSFPGRVSQYLVLPSLEMCIMSSLLKNAGHEVKLYDMKILHHTYSDAPTALQNLGFSPDVVLIDDSPEVHFTTKRILPTIKSLFRGTKIVVRGELATFIPEAILERNSDIDFLIMTDDDYALLNIVSAISSGSMSFDSIDNIAYRHMGSIVINRAPKRQYNLNDLPMPDRRLYDIALYRKRDSETIVRSSRGCPGACSFCIKTRMSQFGLFSMQRFVDEIAQLQGYGFESFFFSDDTFAFSDQRLSEFEAEIDKRKMDIKFTSNIRIKDINEYKISTLKRLGAYRVFVGIETINSATSRGINKNLDEQYIIDKISILKKFNMEFHASFILGAPGDTEEDLKKTMDFVKRIKPTIVTFNMLKVYPGLPYYCNPEKYGIVMKDKFWFESDEWTKHCVMGTNLLPPQTIEKWARRMLFEFIS